ncbi:MAG: DUF692 family multinuclear iron-containing protein [Burkholderiaceae bacterium]
MSADLTLYPLQLIAPQIVCSWPRAPPNLAARRCASLAADAEPDTDICINSGCSVLLDVNHVHVSANNIGFDAQAYLAAFPAALVTEIHLAGHTQDPTYGAALLVDSHDAPGDAAVWALYERLIARIGRRPTLRSIS